MSYKDRPKYKCHSELKLWMKEGNEISSSDEYHWFNLVLWLESLSLGEWTKLLQYSAKDSYLI